MIYVDAFGTIYEVDNGENVLDVKRCGQPAGTLCAKQFASAASKEKEPPSVSIDRVKFSGPATIVFWDDGTKTIVKCMEDDTFDAETGVAMCTLKKIFGDSYSVYKKEVTKKINEAKQKEAKKLKMNDEHLNAKEPTSEDIVGWIYSMIKKDKADE